MRRKRQPHFILRYGIAVYRLAGEQLVGFRRKGQGNLPLRQKLRQGGPEINGEHDLPVRREYAGVEFLLVNTSRPSNLLCSWGFVDRRDAEFIRRRCRLPKAGPRILLSHYPMIEHHPILRMRHRLFGQRPILELMHEKAIDLSLCGHVHKPYLEVDDSGRGECCAGSVTRNGTMVEIDYSDDRFTFRTVTL